MKRSLILLVFLLFAVPAFADPIPYTITWTLTGGTPGAVAPGNQTYTYDPIAKLFAGLSIWWEVGNSFAGWNFTDLFNGSANTDNIQASIVSGDSWATASCGCLISTLFWRGARPEEGGGVDTTNGH